MKKNSDFHIWEGVYSNFEMAEKDKKEDGFSSIRYVAQARQVATESIVKIKEKNTRGGLRLLLTIENVSSISKVLDMLENTGL